MPGLYVGIDIGSKFTKAAVFEHTVKFHLADGFLFPTPMRQARDGDKQIDPEAFIKQLEAFLPAAKLHRAKIAVNLPPMALTALSVYLPLMSKKELLFAAVNEAKQKMIPVSGPNHIFDCLALGEKMINKIPRAEVLVIRTEKVFVQRVMELFQLAEVFPQLITPAATALPLIVPKEAWKKDEAIAIVDIGASYLKIAILSDENMVFVRNIVYGLDDIMQDFARQLATDVAHVDTALKEHGIPDIPFDPKDKVAIAEEIMRQKYEASLATGAPMESQVNELELRLLWQPHIDKLVQELRRSTVFYKEQSEGRKIEKIFFIGGGSCLKNFVTIVQPVIGGDVQVLLPFANMQHQLPNENTFKEVLVSTGIFAGSSSLALGIPVAKGTKKPQVNFLPVELKQREAVAARRLAFLFTVAGILTVFTLLTIHQVVSNQLIRSQIRSIEQKLKKVKRVSEGLKGLEEAQGKVNQRAAFIDELVKKRVELEPMLKDIAEKVPDRILLSKCALTAQKLDLAGSVKADYEEANAILADLKRQLQRLQYIGVITVPALEQEGFSPQVGQAGQPGQIRLSAEKVRAFTLSAEIAGK